MARRRLRLPRPRRQAAPRDNSILHPPDVIGKYAPDETKEARLDGEGKLGGWIGALMYMALGFMKEILFKIAPRKDVVFSDDRVRLSRYAMLRVIVITIHAVGKSQPRALPMVRQGL